MDNIILIGMPGCGKSTVGVLLAKILGYRFLDTDLLIQEKANRRLFEILRDDGNEAFSSLENEVLCSLSAEKTVIATGGSAVLCSEGMEHIKKLGRVVYLKLPLCEIEKRVNNLETRGVLMKAGQTLKDIFYERAPFYEKYADIIFDSENLGLSENALKLSKLL